MLGIVRGASRGQVGAEFALVLAFLFGLGVMSVQFVGLALTNAKVTHAAQEAAYVAGSSVESATDRTPCWAVSGGLAQPAGYADAPVCRTVIENLGDVNPSDVKVTVSPALVERNRHSPIHVSITYRQPITSPLLRLFMGDTFTSSADASSWSN
jgi:Flp pilus assembly protein TadG